jgi:L-threonylcarbamoyladenylate synthase
VTDVLAVDRDRPDPAAIQRAAECLRHGGLVAFPTETVYGLGVNALDSAAVHRLFAAKGRPSTDPLIVHVASVESIAPLVAGLPAAVDRLASRFWPGPLTLVMPRSPVVVTEVTAGLATVAIRVPSHPVAHALVQAAGIPVAAPSANLFSRPSPTRASHVIDDLDGRIDLVLDGGETPVGIESTVLDLSQEIPTVLRPGAVSIEMLREVIPNVRLVSLTVSESKAAPAPGMLEKHYSPRAPLTLYDGPGGRQALITAARAAVASAARVGVIAVPGDFDGDEDLRDRVVLRELGPDPQDVARALYATLRELDASAVDRILVRILPTDDGLSLALRDRLRRAASGNVVVR